MAHKNSQKKLGNNKADILFYKKEKNSFIPFIGKNNILERNQMSKTAVNWKHNNIDNDSISPECRENKKVLQGIKSILSQNRKCLNSFTVKYF